MSKLCALTLLLFFFYLAPIAAGEKLQRITPEQKIRTLEKEREKARRKLYEQVDREEQRKLNKNYDAQAADRIAREKELLEHEEIRKMRSLKAPKNSGPGTWVMDEAMVLKQQALTIKCQEQANLEEEKRREEKIKKEQKNNNAREKEEQDDEEDEDDDFDAAREIAAKREQEQQALEDQRTAKAENQLSASQEAAQIANEKKREHKELNNFKPHILHIYQLEDAKKFIARIFEKNDAKQADAITAVLSDDSRHIYNPEELMEAVVDLFIKQNKTTLVHEDVIASITQDPVFKSVITILNKKLNAEARSETNEHLAQAFATCTQKNERREKQRLERELRAQQDKIDAEKRQEQEELEEKIKQEAERRRCEEIRLKHENDANEQAEKREQERRKNLELYENKLKEKQLEQQKEHERAQQKQLEAQQRERDERDKLVRAEQERKQKERDEQFFQSQINAAELEKQRQQLEIKNLEAEQKERRYNIMEELYERAYTFLSNTTEAQKNLARVKLLLDNEKLVDYIQFTKHNEKLLIRARAWLLPQEGTKIATPPKSQQTPPATPRSSGLIYPTFAQTIGPVAGLVVICSGLALYYSAKVPSEDDDKNKTEKDDRATPQKNIRQKKTPNNTR